jgi:hypothetical protein
MPSTDFLARRDRPRLDVFVHVRLGLDWPFKGKERARQGRKSDSYYTCLSDLTSAFGRGRRGGEQVDPR